MDHYAEMFANADATTSHYNGPTPDVLVTRGHLEFESFEAGCEAATIVAFEDENASHNVHIFF